MKKIAGFVFCLLVLALVIRGTGFGPGTLEIRIKLVEGGPDLTAQFRKYVGFVPDGKTGVPTLGNIQNVRPSAEDDTIYEVPSDRDIGIFVLSPGVPAFQSIVRADAGRHLTHDVVLDAGIVQVTTERTPNTGQAGIWFVGPDGQIDPNDRFTDGAQFTVPAGTQVFQTGRGLEAKTDSIDVIAGQTHHLNIISELGNLTVNLETTLPFDALAPTPFFVTEGGDRLLHDRGEHFDGGRWQSGTYTARLALLERFFIPIRPTMTDAIPIVIDQPENIVTIHLRLMGLEVRFTDWPGGLPEHAMALVVSLSDPGLPFATYRVTDERASLIFLPPKEGHTYAVALVDDGQVRALQTVGPLVADSLRIETVPPGGDPGLCREIIRDFGCHQLSQ